MAHDLWEALARQAAFRDRHRVGQRVRARLLRQEGPGLAWVSVDGQELLAQVAQVPPPGSPLIFLVKSLEPEIQLQDVTPAFNPGTPLAVLAASFLTARSQFDALARQARGPVPRGRPAWRDWLRNKGLLPAFVLCAARAGALSLALAPSGRRFLWLPWLPAGAEAHELMVRATGHGLNEAELSFREPQRGLARLRLLLKPPRASCRLLLERPEAWPQARLPEIPGLDLECLGLERLAPGGRGGVLADTLRGF